MTNLYPIKFDPIVKERVWGGDALVKIYGKEYDGNKAIGESWEISAVEDDNSVVSNGFLIGNDLTDVVETYLGDIVGDKIYERYGNEFPVLIKLLDIQNNLSLQVHPDDETALERHDSYGKTECWYVLDASPDAKIYYGLKEELSAQEFYNACMSETIESSLNVIHPKKGDFLFIPPQTLHAATGGIQIIEVQQVSDITYRVYDWGREHNPATKREMHLELAIDCINFKKTHIEEVVIQTAGKSDEEITLTDCDYFNVKKLAPAGEKRMDSQDYDSFVIFVVAEGEFEIKSKSGSEMISKGESVLIPAYMGEFSLLPKLKGSELIMVTGKF